MIFADDLIDDEDMLMINDDGQLCSVDIKSNVVPPPESSYAMPGPMEMTGGYGGVHPMQQQDGYGAAVRPSQAVQCYECFRYFGFFMAFSFFEFYYFFMKLVKFFFSLRKLK